MLTTTRMSSKGQVVIPEEIRKQLNLKEGARFIVIGQEDVVILKAIEEPSIEEFDALIQQARAAAKQAGLKRADIDAAIARARGKR